MAPVRWSTMNTQNFVELYKDYPCLWDKNEENYKNRQFRAACCQELIQRLGIPDFDIDDCKYKIRNIRSHYLQEIKKIQDAADKGEIYVPVLRWFGLMDSFMRDQIQHQNPRTSTTDETKYEYQEMDNTTNLTTVSNISYSNESLLQEDTHSLKRTYEEEIPQSSKRIFVASTSKSAEAKNHHIEKREAMTPAEKLRIEEFESFAANIIAQLRNMPFEEALRLQLKIQALVTQERLKYLEECSKKGNCEPKLVEKEYQPLVKLENTFGHYVSNSNSPNRDPLNDDM